MKRYKCGNSELKLSSLGLGAFAFGGGDYWGERSQKAINKAVRKGFELGINYFDTAEIYNEGRSEKSLGKALKPLPREKYIIGTKLSPSNAYPGKIKEHCESSLKRLNTDYIDIYLLHWPINIQSLKHFTDDQSVLDKPPNGREAMDAMRQLKADGKVRYLGVSNFDTAALQTLDGDLDYIVSNQLPYSLLTRAIEYDILPFCRDHSIGIIGYITLMQGLLTGKYLNINSLPKMRRRTRHFNHRTSPLSRHGVNGHESTTDKTLRKIKQIGEEAGHSVSEMAIKWAVQNPDITCSLVGGTNEEYIVKNIKAAENPLEDEVYQRLNTATKELKDEMGKSFDYYEHPDNDRTKEVLMD